MPNSSITLLQKLSFALAAVGKDVMYWIFILIYVVYLNLNRIDPLFIIFLFLTSSLLSTVTDPMMGFIVDQTKSKYGRFRPWIMLGTIANSIATILLFTWPNLSGTMLYMYIAAVYMFWFISYTIMDIPYWSLIPAFGSKRKDREQMSAIARLGALVGSQLVVLFGFKFVSYISDAFTLNIKNSFIYIAYVGAALFIVTQLFLCLNFRPRFNYIRRRPISFISLKHIITDNDQIKFLIIIGVLIQICSGIVLSVSILYLMDNAITHISVFIITATVAQLIVFISYTHLLTKFTRHQLFVSSAVILVTASSAMLAYSYLNLNSLVLAVSLYVLCAISLSIATICTTVMTADCVDYGEFKVGLRSEAVVFASQTIASKLGAFFTLIVTGFNIPAMCYMQKYTMFSHDDPISFITIATIPVLTLFTLYIYLKFYKLNGPFFSSILDALEELRQRSQIQTSNKLLLRYALNKSAVILNLDVDDLTGCIKALSSKLTDIGYIRNEELFLEQIHKKLIQHPCGIIEGIAIPHLSSPCITRPVIAFARTARGIECNALDGKKSDLIFLIATPKDGVSHLNLLGRLSLLLNDTIFVEKLRCSVSNDDVIENLVRESVKIQKRDL